MVAQFVSARTDTHQVGGDSGEFHEKDANCLRTFRHLICDSEHLFDPEAVGNFLEDWSNVIHTSTERHALSPGTVFHILFDSGVEEAGCCANFLHVFAIEFHLDSQNTVR